MLAGMGDLPSVAEELPVVSELAVIVDPLDALRETGFAVHSVVS